MGGVEERRTAGLEAWRSRYEGALRDDELFTSISGACVEPLSTPETVAIDYGRDLG